MKPTTLAIAAALALILPLPAVEKPNVILIMTDDQGYGDIAAHGHPHLNTPNMDRLRRDGVRLENFHVDPTCSPTRSALMTGRYSGRVGVWHTIMGRNMLREDETTAAEIFRSAGYRTGIFGKWHLGDTYPYAPRFRGFDDAIVHGGGGVGQTPDFWGNDYFEDHYNDNGSWRPFQGYCTDVWFREALRFIRESRDEPFFLYLPTNAAHQTRRHVAERYRARYANVDTNAVLRIFWGMIENIDDNLGVLLDRLEHWNLLDNTILVFMGDNGSCMKPNAYPESQQAAWSETFNAGMRGNKDSHYDGGHRVFGFVHYPAGGLTGGREVRRLTAHIDVLPTLLDLCGIMPPDGLEFDGKSLVPLLKNPDDETWPERTLVVENQRVIDPVKWRNTAVMNDRWRLIDNKQLYDMHADPGQADNVIKAHPEVAAKLSEFYDGWWAGVSRRHHETTLLHIGAEQENPVRLNAHDWMPPSEGAHPWNQPSVSSRQVGNGTWHVHAARAGRYALTLRERPAVADFPLTATTAKLRISGMEDLSQTVPEGTTGVRFEVELAAGATQIKTWLDEADGTSRGAYFVDVEHLDSKKKTNIILIVTDDQGYADAGFRDPEVHTPNLDKLVAAGVELKRFYTAPVCSPTRAGLMTGLYPIRFGMQRAVNRPFSEVGLPEELTTLPEALGEAGYKERHIVGKWHLGNMRRAQLPMNHGFTHQYGPYCSGIDYFKHTREDVHDFHRNQQTIHEEGYFTDLLSGEAVRIIDGHEGADPFFIYLAHGAPHTPLQAPAKEIERYKHLEKQRAAYLAMVTVIDQGLGRILEALDRKELAENTLIVFFSDNGGGPGSNNSPLKGRKSSLHEGGIRVLAAARWPGRIPAGSVCETPHSYIDIMPTFLDAAGAPVGAEMKRDGRSTMPLWEGKADTSRSDFEFYSFYERRNRNGESLAIIQGNWKLLRQGPPILDGAKARGADIALYDLKNDIGEKTNLAAQHPELVDELLEKLVAFRKLRPEGGVPPMIEPEPEGWKPFPNWEPLE